VTADPGDELARKRSERSRVRRQPRPEAGNDALVKTQQDALARAREAWALRRPAPDGNARDQNADDG
jgi:hypothetical protein